MNIFGVAPAPESAAQRGVPLTCIPITSSPAGQSESVKAVNLSVSFVSPDKLPTVVQVPLPNRTSEPEQIEVALPSPAPVPPVLTLITKGVLKSITSSSLRITAPVTRAVVKIRENIDTNMINNFLSILICVY